MSKIILDFIKHWDNMQKAYEERRANEAGRTFCDYNISWHGLFLYLFFFFRRLTPTETVFGAILALCQPTVYDVNLYEPNVCLCVCCINICTIRGQK